MQIKARTVTNYSNLKKITNTDTSLLHDTCIAKSVGENTFGLSNYNLHRTHSINLQTIYYRVLPIPFSGK